MINWKPIKDRHQEGETPFGKVFIRFNEDKKATAMYTCFGSTKKYLPSDEIEEEDEGARLRLEEIVRVKQLQIDVS